MIGIYRIQNILTGDFYIGSSIEVETRWIKHQSRLRHGKHENTYLQRAYNKYGEDYFIFGVIEECSEQDTLRVEQQYLDLKPSYNLNPYARKPPNMKGVKQSEEHIKMRKPKTRKTKE